MKRNIIFCAIFFLSIFLARPTQAASIEERLSGRILLQVENSGQAWYVDPVTKNRLFLGRPEDAFAVMRGVGLGVSEKDFASWKNKAPLKLSGRIILRVEKGGEAYYIDPLTLSINYLGRPSDAFMVMRKFGLGITNSDINKIPVKNSSVVEIKKEEQVNNNPPSSTCAPVDYNIGRVIEVGTVSELESAVRESSNGNATILLKDGTYNLKAPLQVSGDKIMIRSKSGDRDKVVLEGAGMKGGVSHIFQIYGSDVVIANISFGEIANHAIQIHGESSTRANGLIVKNVRIYNTGEQMIKGSTDGKSGSNNGLVECSLLEYTSKFGPQYYIGGIDVHMGDGWIVSNNVFKNIRSPQNEISEHAIHFWNGTKNALVEENKIINCDRGIGFGLGSQGNVGGIIRNNTIFNDGQGLNDDVGIALENSNGTKVYNNTIFFDGDYRNAIEYRFSNSKNIEIKDNLTNKSISARDGASASLSGNYTEASRTWFTDPNTGNLSLNGKQGAELTVGYRGQ
jgi:hypothetical protein